jgi:hypothetical protein
MFEVFFYAFNGEDLFDKGFSAYGMGGAYRSLAIPMRMFG